MGVSGGVATLRLVLALAHAPASSTALAIDITALMPMSSAQLRTMVSETEEIWKPHGVVFTWITSAATSDPLPYGVVRILSDKCHVVPLCLPAGRDTGESRPPATRRLGAVVFRDGNATAENTLLLSVDAIAQVVESVKWQNRSFADLPTDTRGYLIGRGLGRVLAHEIAHYLLGWRIHAQAGLMRPQFRADQLVSLSRHEFELSEKQVASLRLRLAQLAGRSRDLARNDDRSPSQPQP